MDKVKDDDPLPTYPIPEGVKIGSADLGSDYGNRVYYQLSTNTTVKTIINNDYDLAFENSENGWHILLNSSRFMQAGSSGTKDFESVTSPAGIPLTFDSSSGDLDSTAVGNWADFSVNPSLFYKEAYVVDLGLDQQGLPLGYKKTVFEELMDDIYTVRFANMDGSSDFTVQLPKVDDRNYIGLSFNDNGTVIDFEPPTQDWDIFFGQYTTMLFSEGEPYPYLVRGVLLNTAGTAAYPYTGDKTFLDIEIEDVDESQFTTQQDIIGHEWKYYNLEEGVYTVNTEQVYFIKSLDGSICKFHFLSYYNSNGETGYPKFEFKKLG
jgi:hypothetical protein